MLFINDGSLWIVGLKKRMWDDMCRGLVVVPDLLDAPRRDGNICRK